ncbi:catalase [Flexivirga caeni]|uniref:Catalase n=1 Tax=Flexivirga caeni TaxID=2294115 RepID=A0A3M9MBK3_9MICO|nr:catalase [Flexivirga caeni]RNI22926.1 catalase [Flexivirga caeni]
MTESTRPIGQHGNAGELQQQATDGEEVLTTAQGVAIPTNQNSLTAGDRGPTMLSDFVLREKIFRFDHERIPERVVHARGYGAHGTFESSADLSEVTRAHLFGAEGRTVPVFVRFSTVAGSRGSFDLARDVRGFAVKFYTAEGNWDLVGNNIPVFFIQDAMKFPDLVHAVKDEPDRGFPQAQSAHDNFWDFAAHMPESTHMTLWQMSDRAIPRSFRFMEGFGVHTFRLVNADGASTFVKFHWKPVLGMQSVVWNEAVKINGADPDFHRRDLWDAITSGDLPQWDLAMQLFDQDTADELPFDVLDPTKLVPEEAVPVQVVGRLTLDRVVDNDFAETEQVAFCTQNVVPGIDFTDDPLLQGRNFSYLDTQLSRLGSPNFTQLPVNAPRCPVANFARDGHMQTDLPAGPVNYEPNGYPTGHRGPRPDQEASFTSFAEPVTGTTRRLRPESFGDHYSQARVFWISQTEIEQQHIVDAYVFELSKVQREEIRAEMVANLRNVDEDLAAQVADGLGLSLPAASTPFVPVRTDLPASPALSMLRNQPQTFAGRKLGIVLTDGSDAAVLAALRDQVEAAHGTVEIVAPKVGGVTLDDGSRQPADQLLKGAPSVLYDAVALLPSADGARELARDPAAKDFVNDAFNHFKFIGVGSNASPVFAAAGLGDDLDQGCPTVATPEDVSAFVDGLAALRFWERPIAG